ncbi:MAG: hypothetical protein ABI663_12165 [Chryseolinea sp.]
MKRTFLIILILIAVTALHAAAQKSHVSILSIKRDIFYFKVDKTLMGATLEVFSQQGEMIFSGKVLHHKAIIDFYLENPGTYTIKLKKDDQATEFVYVKSSASGLQPIEMESASASISLIQ